MTERKKRPSAVQRSMKGARRQVGQMGRDIKKGIDPAVLSVLRFVGLLYGPIDRNVSIGEALRKAKRYRLPAHIGWRHAFGGITYLLLIVLVVSGVLLSVYYRPSAQEAYPSIQHIVSEISFGWLARDLHFWAANLIVIAIVGHMARVFFEATYKPPREMNWLVGVLLFALVIAFGATGYLLPWDQWAYWAVSEVLESVENLPILGGFISSALTGDVVVSGATLSRYFALHVVILPWIALALLLFHFGMVRKHRAIAPAEGGPGPEVEGVPFFPNHLLRAFIVSLLLLAVLVSLAVLFPRPMTHVADPAVIPDHIVSTWFLLDVSLALHRYLGDFGLPLVLLFGVLLAALPILDRSPERKWRNRPVLTGLGVGFLLALAAVWLVGRQIRTVSPHLTDTTVQAVEESDGIPVPPIGPRPVMPNPDATAAGEDR